MICAAAVKIPTTPAPILKGSDMINYRFAMEIKILSQVEDLKRAKVHFDREESL